MTSLRFLVELKLDEDHPGAVLPDTIMEAIQDLLSDEDSKSIGIQTETVSVMPHSLCNGSKVYMK